MIANGRNVSRTVARKPERTPARRVQAAISETRKTFVSQNAVEACVTALTVPTAEVASLTAKTASEVAPLSA